MFVASVGTPTTIYILGAAFAGGLLPLLYQAAQNWRKGPLTDSQLISRTVSDQLGGMKTLLENYRIELEVAKRQLEDYRTQLGTVTRELATAQVRISQLERTLDSAKDRRDEMEHELEQLRRQQGDLITERRELETITRNLADRLRQLGLVVGDDGEVRATGSGGGAISP